MPPAARGRPLAPPARGESRCVRCPQGSQARPRGMALPPFGSNFPRTASGRAYPSLAEGPLPPQGVREDAEMFFNNKLLSVKDNFFANTGRKERLPAGIFRFSGSVSSLGRGHRSPLLPYRKSPVKQAFALSASKASLFRSASPGPRTPAAQASYQWNVLERKEAAFGEGGNVGVFPPSEERCPLPIVVIPLLPPALPASRSGRKDRGRAGRRCSRRRGRARRKAFRRLRRRRCPWWRPRP